MLIRQRTVSEENGNRRQFSRVGHVEIRPTSWISWAEVVEWLATQERSQIALFQGLEGIWSVGIELCGVEYRGNSAPVN